MEYVAYYHPIIIPNQDDLFQKISPIYPHPSQKCINFGSKRAFEATQEKKNSKNSFTRENLTAEIPNTWRFGSDDFPFQLDDFEVQNVNFPGCLCVGDLKIWVSHHSSSRPQ